MLCSLLEEISMLTQPTFNTYLSKLGDGNSILSVSALMYFTVKEARQISKIYSILGGDECYKNIKQGSE